MVLNIDKRRIAAPQSTHPQVSIPSVYKNSFQKGVKGYGPYPKRHFVHGDPAECAATKYHL